MVILLRGEGGTFRFMCCSTITATGVVSRCSRERAIAPGRAAAGAAEAESILVF